MLLSVAAAIVTGYAQPTVATIGGNLKAIRGEEDQKEVAARMGVPQARLSNWEKNRYRTLTVKTLLWLARGYRCGVEDILRGVDAEYDRVRDLTRHGREYESASHQGGSDVPASSDRDDRELRQLRAQIAEYKALLGQVENAASTLATVIAAGEQIGTSARPQSKTRRRDRKAG